MPLYLQVVRDVHVHCHRPHLRRRLASGYRDYAPGDLRRLRFIHCAKALGFTLPGICELLALSARRNDDMAAVKTAAAAKIAAIDDTLAELQRVRAGLAMPLPPVAAPEGHARRR